MWKKYASEKKEGRGRKTENQNNLKKERGIKEEEKKKRKKSNS